MAIKPVCEKCKNELEDFGGILLSPPDENEKVKKSHLCKSCYEKIINEIKESS
ncbi:MAG: hypothetical protein KJ646_03385 [Nanoarchaeota archaeon]|nr:hypothetical protein [Nanoarchaeota archaeon]MBU4116910.1 hypothetical protein [Nanoarchaeota archaeon]MBU4580795.1 hypothetical protein [Patescibacteria group bacterium]